VDWLELVETDFKDDLKSVDVGPSARSTAERRTIQQIKLQRRI
jgi:hypothetical protein